MAKTIENWLETDVRPVKDKPLRWISEQHFFRDPLRSIHADSNYFFSPADGIILYQKVVEPGEEIVEIKGKAFSLRESMRDSSYNRMSMVIGIFMTFYDVHINRIPFSGRLTHVELDSIDTLNYPMLAVEKGLVDELQIDTQLAHYLRNNQRVLNRVYASKLGQPYYILQIADYDVDSIVPFDRKQNRPCLQNRRFSQIRYGSQVDLIVPVSDRYDFTFTQEPGTHVEAGIDTLIRITEKTETEYRC